MDHVISPDKTAEQRLSSDDNEDELVDELSRRFMEKQEDSKNSLMTCLAIALLLTVLIACVFIYQHLRSINEPIDLVLSQISGYIIVIASAFTKLPQIYKILSAKSADGLSRTMYYLDYIMLM